MAETAEETKTPETEEETASDSSRDETAAEETQAEETSDEKDEEQTEVQKAYAKLRDAEKAKKAAEAKLRKREREELSETEQLKSDLQEAQAEAGTAQEDLQKLQRQVVVAKVAARLNFHDGDVADKLLSADVDVESEPAVERALKQLAKERPYLVNQSGRSGAAVNPSTGKALTAEEEHQAWFQDQARKALGES